MELRLVSILVALIISLPALAAAEKLNLISVKKYSALNSMQQAWYTFEIQKAWLQFELAYPKAGELSDQASFWQKFVFTEAIAATAPKCIVGGVAVGTKVVNGKTVCNTQSRPCVGESDGYLCGSVFASLCVPRTPTKGLSTRCAQPKTTPSKADAALDSLKALTPDQYASARKETLANFEILCAEKAANNQEECNNAALSMKELSTSPQLISAPSNVPDTGMAPAKGTCAYGRDPATGHALQLPQFGFSEEYSCLYKSNQANLARVATSGCATSGHKVGNELFLTRFRSVNDSYLFNTSNVFDSIVEDVAVMQRNSPSDIIYNVRMLKPNTQSVPVALERTTLQVKFLNGQYFLCLPDCATKQEPIKIENAVRSNIMPERLKAISRTGMDALMDGKVMLAKNCRLAAELTGRNLYSAGSGSTKSTTAPKKAQGTR